MNRMSSTRKPRISQRSSAMLRNSITDEITLQSIVKASEKAKSSQKYLRKHLLLPLSCNMRLMAETCFLSTYEANKIIKSYLSMWSIENDDTYIQIEKIISKYSSEYSGLIRTYFNSGFVNYSDYFLFVCIFAFFDVSHILTMLLTMCQVYSNLYITLPQIKYFMEKLHLNESIYFDLEYSLEIAAIDMPGSQATYSIKSFLGYFQNSIAFQAFIYQVKLITVNVVFTNYHYKNIMNRIKYYYNKNTQQDPIIIPSESCCYRISRVLFTSEPSPYHYDYCLENPDKSAFDNMINKIRHQCGYSSRTNSIHGLIQMKSSNVHIPVKVLTVSCSSSSPQIHNGSLGDRMRHRTRSSHNYIVNNNSNNNNDGSNLNNQISNSVKRSLNPTSIRDPVLTVMMVNPPPNNPHSINDSLHSNNSNTRHMSIPNSR